MIGRDEIGARLICIGIREAFEWLIED